MSSIGIPLADCADEWIRQLARTTGAARLTELDGTTLLGERAMLSGFTIPGRISAGGGCRLYDAANDRIALNLARFTDRELLPALFAADYLDANDGKAVAMHIASSDATSLLARGRLMGLAIAAEHESPPVSPHVCSELVRGPASQITRRSTPRVVDLSALWAGPLTAHLLWLAGAEVIKVESRSRPDAMRDGDSNFFALLNQGKASVVLDFSDRNDHRALLALIADADIVIEAARPRALLQLSIDAEQIVRTTPGLTWLTLTGHGASGEAANWVGLGDDCGVAGGLSAALYQATGRHGFVGDAIADPLTGIFAANIAWRGWQSRHGGRHSVAMSRVVATAIAATRARDAAAWEACLRTWSNAAGGAFPTVTHRSVSSVSTSGSDTQACLARINAC